MWKLEFVEAVVPQRLKVESWNLVISPLSRLCDKGELSTEGVREKFESKVNNSKINKLFLKDPMGKFSKYNST